MVQTRKSSLAWRSRVIHGSLHGAVEGEFGLVMVFVDSKNNLESQQNHSGKPPHNGLAGR